jgi:hypothetical protein
MKDLQARISPRGRTQGRRRQDKTDGTAWRSRSAPTHSRTPESNTTSTGQHAEAFTGDYPFVVDSNGADEMGTVTGGSVPLIAATA